MRIYLIGYMASGKSKLARELAELTGFDFLDLDAWFEERYRIELIDFFEKYGEPAFRRIEDKLLFETESRDNCIIATGGGTPCSLENINFIKSNGISFYIRLSVADLVSRLINVRKKRPLLRNIPQDQLEEFIRIQLKEREQYYLMADHIINGTEQDKNQIIEFIGLQTRQA